MPPKAAAKSRGKAAGAANAEEAGAGLWVYKADLQKKGEDEGWAPFGDEAQRVLEENFHAGRPSSTLSINGKDYRVDYKKMLQVRVDDQSLQRPVARQVKPAAPKPQAGGAAASSSNSEPAAKRAKKASQRQQFEDADEEQVAPQPGGRVHFSGVLMNDEQISAQCSKPFKKDVMSDILGVGRYPQNNLAFTRAIRGSFDSVAVDAGTRVIVYSDRNFQGQVLWDQMGPAIVCNKTWADADSWFWLGGKTYRDLLTSTWKEPLQTIFPPEVRGFSSGDLEAWIWGSVVITSGEAIPQSLNGVKEYAKLSNPRL